MSVNKTTKRLLVMGTVVAACLFFATAGLYAQNYALSVPSATSLSADGRGSAPTNVRTYTPMLSWTFSDADAGDNQTAYHIKVGTSSGANDMWDVTQTSATRTRMYGGLPLAANTTYYWAVQVWDRAGQPSAFTAATFAVLDIGLRIYNGTSAIKIAVDRYNSLDPVSDANRLRISKSGTSYCIPLLNLTDFGASKIHIRTASATKALGMMVAPAPAIGISIGNLGFSGVSGGSSPAAQTVSVTNVGGGTLSGLGASVSYGSGSGWLSASLNTATAPATLTVTANPAALSAGTYTATVAIASGVASNSPQNVLVSFAVAPPPAIGLSPGTLSFSGVSTGTSPAAQTVSVTNTGGGTLSGLSAGISYGSGSGWLSASLNTTTAPATLTVSANPAALSAGTYTATVAVSSGVASNSPQNVGVTFVVAPPPTISLSPGTLAFSGVAGGTSPAGQTVAVTNTGGGTLSGLSAGISYGSGSGWLSASLNTTTAPATLTVTASLGSLAAGTYTATVSVSSAVAANSPQNIGVTFTVRAPAGRLLFVYNTDPTEANSYETLFEAHDWLVTTVAMASTVGYSFSPFDLIVIGSDTGAFENWGTSAEVTAINGSGKKVIGFGEGGYAFFGQLSLTVGFPNGWHGSLTDMIAVTPSSSLYTTPNTVTLGSGNVISVYTSAGDVGIFLPTIPSDIVVIGSEVGDAEHNQHYDVLKQGTRYLLWGYSAPAGNLTANGANLLLNILYFMTH